MSRQFTFEYNFMWQYNPFYSCHVLYRERWEHRTKCIGLNLNRGWLLELMSYSWMIVWCLLCSWSRWHTKFFSNPPPPHSFLFLSSKVLMCLVVHAFTFTGNKYLVKSLCAGFSEVNDLVLHTVVCIYQQSSAHISCSLGFVF